MSTRIFIRIIVPSTYRVVRSVEHATQNYMRNHVNNNVTSSHFRNVKERRMLSQQHPVSQAKELTVDFDYVKKATANNETLIIDVREPEEVKEHGKIPNSINIPLGNVATVLGNLSEKEFLRIYQRPKPKEETEMIFYCMIGKRSGKAQQNALGLGFKNAKNYLGSWTDWATKIQ
ncbi:unnamed protein product [Arctia plantaginis]|uniref:Rhodanese domain-containing protein n=1 Tax=Arctia plantaginis TaxID=874455 RepID=A0A8S1A376_ARCPL|nr:unnamed protein product [Arctia plantaginis]